MTESIDIRTLMFEVIQDRWSKFIDDPTGFPNNPPDTCWIWTGAVDKWRVKSNPVPVAKLFRRVINPSQIIYYLYNNIIDKPNYKLTHCINPLCVNPKHQKIKRYTCYDPHQPQPQPQPEAQLETQQDPDTDVNGYTVYSYQQLIKNCTTIEEVTGILEYKGASPDYAEKVIRLWKQR